MNEDDFEITKKRFGALMLRRCICVDMIKSYSKEVEDIDKEINELAENIKGVKEDGESVQQA